MLGSRKRNSYVIPVWSGKTVLEMLFVESTSLIWPIYLALSLQLLTELDCKVVPYDSKMYTIIQLDVVSAPQHLSPANLLFSPGGGGGEGGNLHMS